MRLALESTAEQPGLQGVRRVVKAVFPAIVAFALFSAGSSLIADARAGRLHPSSLFAVSEPATLALVGTALLAVSRAAAKVPPSGVPLPASRSPRPERRQGATASAAEPRPREGSWSKPLSGTPS
jgi:hypothetical protein